MSSVNFLPSAPPAPQSETQNLYPNLPVSEQQFSTTCLEKVNEIASTLSQEVTRYRLVGKKHKRANKVVKWLAGGTSSLSAVASSASLGTALSVIGIPAAVPVQNFCRDLAENAEIVQRFKKTPSSRRDRAACRDLTETAEIASRLQRSRRDRAKIYGDSNISPRSRRECQDRAAISPEIVQRFKKTLSSRRDLAEIVLRFMETLTSRRDCRDRAAMPPRSCRDLRHYHLAEITEISPRSSCDLWRP